MNKRCLYIIVVSLFNICTVFPQNKISGEISTCNKSKIEGAQIVLTIGDSLAGMALSDTEGIYKLEGLNAGKYQLKIDALGYISISKEINVQGNTEVNIILQEDSVESMHLEEIVVTANRSDLVKINTGGSVFYLSPSAQKSGDVYNALLEIPRLNVNILNRSISMDNGNSLLILVNGVPREGALEGIDPKDITSVELMDTPSVRYLSEGVTNVLNIKTKRKNTEYQLLNLNTQHNWEGYYGTGNGGYETGASNYSFYVNGDAFYFNNNHAKQHEEQYTPIITKQYDAKVVTDYLSYNITLGGDWVINDKNYLSYNISLRDIPTSIEVEGQGSINEDNNSYDYTLSKKDKTSSLVNVYNLYYRYKISEHQELENQLNLTYNRNNDRNTITESGNGYDYKRYNHFIINHYKGNYLLNYLKESDNETFFVGSQTNFEQTSIKLPLLPTASFKHQRWKEYLYADYSKYTNSFSYQASIGLDMIFNQIAQEKNNYYRFKYSLSGVYNPISPLTFKLWGQGYTQEPGVAYLNPYNTSTDSLSIIQGNTKLTPSYIHNLGVSISWNNKGWYISPEFGYNHVSDVVTPVGYLNDKGVYVSTYQNMNKEQSIYLAGIVRYQIKNLGSVGYNVSYRRYFFYNGVHESISNSFNWNLRYKSVYLNGRIYFMPKTFTPIKRTKSSSESLVTLGCDITSSFGIMASLRYYTGAKHSESWISQPDFQSYYSRVFENRKNMLLVGFRYRWEKGQNKERRNSKLNVNNERLELLK